ncbi:ketol-acid reductoisomerase [candidate division MSBL1 archaeon SCGC-AAA259E17]|uniref:Ketol-acid reductoisomerase (NADP(+)) n=1 Tax=candidate division MSBL1 archaeon SCGC-AAA259E17 TaxID=1698263 RepID=A0A133UF79_9EURY|nr:ketol-acid reductoisomerase [candidate division MSBL1 archaeon SCGC-AAA259E17]
MAKIYTDEEASLDPLEGKTIAVIGYGSQGHAQAQNMRDSGCEVIIGNPRGDEFWEKAESAGFDVYEISEAAKRGDIIHMLIPDEVQAKVYNEQVAPAMGSGKVLGFSHGFNIHFKEIVPPRDDDVIMIAPKAPGPSVRESYEEGSGVPGLVAVAQDSSGEAMDVALAMAKAVGLTRIGVIETSFEEEVETDLFGEQSVLVGGVSEMIKAGFETLVEDGYQPEVAYFECLNELKLIVDLIHKQGIEGMMRAVSNTAEYGGRTRGPRIVDEDTRKEMEKLLEDIKDGSFAKEWITENQRGAPNLKEMREEAEDHLIERVGKEIREWSDIEG